MCLIVFAYQPEADIPLILLAHRDEFTARPTAALGWWKDKPDILGGRDLLAQGSWLAVSKNGRLAAITNVRQGAPELTKKSRGEWVAKHLLSSQTADESATQASTAHEYGGFNALFGHWQQNHFYLSYGSNRFAPQRINPGIHALSNGELNAPWPKARAAKDALSSLMSANAQTAATPDPEWLYQLRQSQIADDTQLPDTGIGIEKERWLSPMMITGEHYGTRAATLLWMRREGQIHMTELSLAPERSGEIVSSHSLSFARSPPHAEDAPGKFTKDRSGS